MADLLAQLLEKGSQGAMIALAVYLITLERRLLGIFERVERVENHLLGGEQSNGGRVAVCRADRRPNRATSSEGGHDGP